MYMTLNYITLHHITSHRPIHYLLGWPILFKIGTKCHVMVLCNSMQIYREPQVRKLHMGNILVVLMINSTDTNPPVLTCVKSVETDAATPNILRQLDEVTDYTATDPSTPFSTSYDPPVSFPFIGGSLFAPGDTTVTFTVTDACGNPSSCDVTVTNSRKHFLLCVCRGVDPGGGGGQTYRFAPLTKLMHEHTRNVTRLVHVYYTAITSQFGDCDIQLRPVCPAPPPPPPPTPGRRDRMRVP